MPRPKRKVDYGAFPILYVDDEPENLRTFELGFRRDFQIVTADSAEEALGILRERRIALVLSDHKMPGMTGTEFLANVRDIDPKTIRILVTAYGDAETLGSAINDGSIYKYVPKPWDADQLGITLRRALEVYALDQERDALIRELSTLNHLARTINQELALEPLLNLLLSAMSQMLHYDGACLLLLDEPGDVLRFAAHCPANDGVARALSRICIGASEAPELFAALREGRSTTLRFDQVARYESPLREWLTEVAADEVVLVPLRGKRGLIGALAVDDRRGRHSFDDSDRALLEGVAVHAVIAIENARLVDDLRRSRQQVLRSERLGTLGTLAAGLAHEINNPLVSIHTFLSLVPEKRHEEDEEFWGDYHRLACQEVERIRGLVATMSRLGRASGERPELVPCDLGALAHEVTTLLSREARSAHVRFGIDIDASTPKVRGVREQLHQVLLNLVLNAIHASEKGGEVRLRVSPAAGDRRTGARVEVADCGQGIPEEYLERIFDPFFTTKGPDHGTGLGLMICHQIVSEHGGTIDVASRPGEGATFRLHLPAGDAGEGQGSPPVDQARPD